MTGMDDRERNYENKFAHEQEVEFKIRARRDKMLGMWAADKMSMDEDDGEDYAAEIVDFDVVGNGEDAILEKVLYDLRDAGVDISEEDVRTEMENLLRIAKDEEY